MIVAKKEDGARQESGCKKYPLSGEKAKYREAVELFRRQVADPALFIAMAIRQRSAPRTEVVKKNQAHHRFGFEFPVAIKPLDGRPMQKAVNQAELKKITTDEKSE